LRDQISRDPNDDLGSRYAGFAADGHLSATGRCGLALVALDPLWHHPMSAGNAVGAHLDHRRPDRLTALWDWPQWPKRMGTVIRELDDLRYLRYLRWIEIEGGKGCRYPKIRCKISACSAM
jgi:hypothetical protein